MKKRELSCVQKVYRSFLLQVAYLLTFGAYLYNSVGRGSRLKNICSIIYERGAGKKQRKDVSEKYRLLQSEDALGLLRCRTVPAYAKLGRVSRRCCGPSN